MSDIINRIESALAYYHLTQGTEASVVYLGRKEYKNLCESGDRWYFGTQDEMKVLGKRLVRVMDWEWLEVGRIW